MATNTVNGVEATYKNAIVRALDAAKMKAEDSRETCGHKPVDYAAQAALEHSSLTGTRFETAYDEVFQTTWYLMSEHHKDLSSSEAAEQLDRVRVELLRVTYEK